MLNNLIKYTIRSFKRQKSYILINITGLSIALACSLLIAMYVFNELSFDRFNAKKERIYNVVLNFRIGDLESTEATSSPPLGETMLREIPEIENFLRMKRLYGANTVKFNNQVFTEENIIETDSSFFDFFTIPILRGDKGNLLNAPRKVVLSSSLAERIFGNQNPIDKVIQLGKDTSSYIVTGVIKDIPGNCHFKAGMLVSMLSDAQAESQDWGNNNMSTYVLLNPNADYISVDEKLKPLVVNNLGPILQKIMKLSFEEFLEKGNKYGYYLQKLTDIHLDTSVKPHFLETGDPKLLKILIGIALLILLIAAVNFTNLSTAQASARSKEIAIKKLAGSSRLMLITQFLTESVLMSFASAIIALIIIKLVLPIFNDLLGTNLALKFTATGYIIPFILLFPLITGIIAGSYPAFFLSSFNPNLILKGGRENSSHRGRLRKVLVTLQFTVSIFLIIGTLIMYSQITYMLNKDPGFNNDHLLVLENEGALGSNLHSFKETVAGIPGVISLTSSSYVPGDIRSNQGYALEGRKDETILMWTNYVDYNFIETYGMDLKSGRFFNREFQSDEQACLVNESAIKKYSIDTDNMRILGYGDSGPEYFYPIIGVVKDFIFESQKNQIGPVIFRLKPENQRYGSLTVKLSQQNFRKTLGEIENTWKKFTKDEPLKYTFIDDIMNQLYSKEKKNAIIAGISSILAIFIAVLGLFGLISFSLTHRTKEIGVRKAMGSSVINICYLLSLETIILVTISALISFPVIYYASRKWLEDFYYRISPGFLIFLVGLIITMVIALLTISYRTVHAAKMNTAASLRYE
jgi:putative ABC transport system permease protein